MRSPDLHLICVNKPKAPSEPDPERDQASSTEKRPVPSQAEGDEETIDEDLRQKEEAGEI
jgi:hypothetical protein